jgi:hypothetical protein
VLLVDVDYLTCFRRILSDGWYKYNIDYSVEYLHSERLS